MKVITELELRDLYKLGEFTSYQLEPGTRLTPAAAQFLSERRITVAEGNKTEQGQNPGRGRLSSTGATPTLRAATEIGATSQNGSLPQTGSSPSTGSVPQTESLPKYGQLPQVDASKGYTLVNSGEKVPEKGEFLTHLRGTNLVPKNHPRIKFRGKLDSLEALLITSIVEIEAAGYRDLARDLTEALDYTRQIMSAEVLEKPLAPMTFHGMTHLEVRERSHHPEKYYGIGHIFVQPSQGKLLASLNFIRTQVRELELTAMDAFYNGQESEQREDLIQSLNRLSSLVYVMMLQLASGQYRLG